MKYYVCKTQTGYEIIKSWSKPAYGLCETPVDPDTETQVPTLDFLDVNYFYYVPDSNTKVATTENGEIPQYYKNHITQTWHTPVPDPIPSYWIDNGVWKDSSVDVPPENTIPVSTTNTPLRLAEAVINMSNKQTFLASRLSNTKVRKILQIETKYKQLCAEDYLWTDGKLYQVSDDLRDGLNAINTGLYTDRPWMAKDNTLRTFTVTEFKELGKAIFDRGDAYFVKKQIKKAEVNALTTEASVNSYSVSTGWTD